MSKAESPVDAARELLESGEARGAISALRTAADRHDLSDPPELLAATLALLAEAALGVDMAELAKQARAAVPLGAQEVYDTGMACLENGLPRLAIPMLSFTNLVVPDQEGVQAPLASALELSWRHREAWELVQNSTVLTGFLADYLVAFNAICAGDVDVARELVATLQVEPEVPEMAERVREMLARFDEAEKHTELDDGDLQGWHYVMHGGQVLHLSPYGFPMPMHGRYGWLQDSAARIGLGLERVEAVLRAWGRLPSQVVATPDVGSGHVAAALARQLGVPVVPWSEGVSGLVAVYDLAEVDPEIQLALCDRGEQLLFAHGMRWEDAPATVPDLVTLLHQVLVAPWGDRIVIGEPVDETDIDWVERILTEDRSTVEMAEESEEDIVRFAGAVGPSAGERRYWGVGPVPSVPML